MISKILVEDENIEENKEKSKKVPRDVYLVAQEIKIAKSLACNDVRLRDKQLKKLKKWLSLRSNSSFPFSDADFLRIWKGLFYSMWMSDKPLVQETLAEELGSLLKCFSRADISAKFFGAFLKTMCLEWFGIDQWRIDKFMMLVRRMLRYMFGILKDAKWKTKFLKAFNNQLVETVLAKHEVTGLIMHFVDIYLEELAKVANGDISAAAVASLVKPFVRFLAIQKDYKLLSHLRRNIFYHLLWQSDLGREFTDKFNAWKEMGFPTESIDDLEKVEQDDGFELIEDNDMDKVSTEETESKKEKHLDPRAGCVDVVVPEIPVNAEPIISEMETLQFDDITNTRSRKVIREILEKFKIFNSGEFPLGVKRMPTVRLDPIKPIIDKKVEDLEKFEEELYSKSRQLKKLNKKKRKRILQSINVENGNINEENFEQILEELLPPKRQKISENRPTVVKKTENDWKIEDVKLPDRQQIPLDTIELKHRMEKREKKKLKQTASLIKPFKQVDGLATKKQKRLKALKEKVTHSSMENSIDEETDRSVQSAVTDSSKKLKKKSNVGSCNKEAVITSPVDKPKKSDSPEKQKKVKHADSSASIKSAWNEPLKDGEIEYFVRSRKDQVEKANQSIRENERLENSSNQSNLVLNPFAKDKGLKKKARENNQLLGKNMKKSQSLRNIRAAIGTPESSEKKRVKIVLKRNSAQKASEYIKQVLNSPQMPYNADAKPTKSLLKPNLMPSPINPFYKKKIGLKLLNDTM